MKDESTLSESVSFSGYVNINCAKSIKQSDDKTSSTEMEVEDEDKLLQRLFFKKFGRALPKKKSDEADLDIDPKDLTEEQDKWDAIPTLAPVDIVKKESIKIPKPVINVIQFLTPKRKSQEKEAPSREKSDLNRMSSQQTSLLRVDNKLKMVQNRLKVKNLKQRRADIYDSIRKGEKTLMKKIQRSDQSDWEHIQSETRENVNTLTKIMDNLRIFGLEKTQGEVTQYLNFSNRLAKLRTKINHIIANQEVNISGKVEPLTEQSVLGEEICGNLSTQSLKSENLHAMQQVQEEDDKRRKDAADHTAKQYKLTSAGASSMPVGLTPRPDSNRTQQGHYAEAGPQFMGQHFRQPPPMFPNPPPMPPNLPTFQQHQHAAGFPEKLPLTVNYNGIPKLKYQFSTGNFLNTRSSS